MIKETILPELYPDTHEFTLIGLFFIPLDKTRMNKQYLDAQKNLTTKKLIEGFFLFCFTIMVVKDGKVVLKLIIIPIHVIFLIW